MARAAAKSAARRDAELDLDESEALAAAARELALFSKVANPEAVASAVISRWIIERMRRTASRRMTGEVVFDLGDAKLRGMVEASLPRIGSNLAAAGFDFSKSFTDLSRDEAIRLFFCGCVAYREVAVAAGESRDFPFSDPIPFGPITSEEVPF